MFFFIRVYLIILNSLSYVCNCFSDYQIKLVLSVIIVKLVYELDSAKNKKNKKYYFVNLAYINILL